MPQFGFPRGDAHADGRSASRCRCDSENAADTLDSLPDGEQADVSLSQPLLKNRRVEPDAIVRDEQLIAVWLPTETDPHLARLRMRDGVRNELARAAVQHQIVRAPLRSGRVGVQHEPDCRRSLAGAAHERAERCREPEVLKHARMQVADHTANLRHDIAEGRRGRGK